MKKLIILLCAFVLPMMAFADRGDGAEILLRKKNNTGHLEQYLPVDAPVAYFDDVAMEVIIEAEGYADYYIVEVVSMVSSLTVIYTQIDGYGDSIDVSSLPIGYYQLIITSEFNNVYEGYFTHKNDPRFSPFNYK